MNNALTHRLSLCYWLLSCILFRATRVKRQFCVQKHKHRVFYHRQVTRYLYLSAMNKECLLSFQLKCSSNIDSIHYLGLTNSFHQVPRDIHTLPVKEANSKYLIISGHFLSIYDWLVAQTTKVIGAFKLFNRKFTILLESV